MREACAAVTLLACAALVALPLVTDASPPFVDAIGAGQMHAFVLQDPFRMAGLAVHTLVDHLLGKPVPKRVDTDVTLVTPENLDTPQMKELLEAAIGAGRATCRRS